MPIEFAKLSGSGNDFICIDGRDGRHDELLADAGRAGRFAVALCARVSGVGADGVIFALPANDGLPSDLVARFFEPDGSQAELCGNGAACLARWAIDAGAGSRGKVTLDTSAGAVQGERRDGSYVRVCIPLPQRLQRDMEIEIGGRRWSCDFAVTGVPHVVTYVENLDALDVPRLGAAFRHHPRFAPRGANANFAQVLGEGEIALRTFEFGVEGETLACGTGSAAAAVLSAMRFDWPPAYARGERPVLVHARGGDVIRVYLAIAGGGRVTDLCIETVVRFLYTGVLHPQTERAAMGVAGEP